MAKSFTDTQYEFAAFIRDPEHQPSPDNIESRRMAIYRDLFFNNFNNTLQSAFPVIRSLHTETAWLAIIRDFMISHHCKTPLFVEIAREFMDYLDKERSNPDDPPFMQELAHYEWVELALSTAEAEFSVTSIADNEDSLSLGLKKSPLAWLQLYQFPVHHISLESQPEKPGETPTCLLIYRGHEDKVSFIELNPVSAHLLELIDDGMSGYEAAETIAKAIKHPNPEVVIAGARQMINDWLSRGIILKRA